MRTDWARPFYVAAYLIALVACAVIARLAATQIGVTSSGSSASFLAVSIAAMLALCVGLFIEEPFLCALAWPREKVATLAWRVPESIAVGVRTSAGGSGRGIRPALGIGVLDHMDYRLWLAGIGIASVLLVWGFHQAGRKKANAHLLTHGVLVDAEILKCDVHTDRFAWTEVTFAYFPTGADKPVTVTRMLDGGVRMAVGTEFRCGTCLRTPTYQYLWAMRSVTMRPEKTIGADSPSRHAAWKPGP